MNSFARRFAFKNVLATFQKMIDNDQFSKDLSTLNTKFIYLNKSNFLRREIA